MRGKADRCKVQLRSIYFGCEPLEHRTLLSHGAPTKHKPSLGGGATPPVTAAASIALSSSSWTPIGPAPTSNGPIAGGGAISGRINAVAADPTNANIIYVATAAGGVWKTTNGGTSWTPLTDSQSTLNMGAIAVAPSAPNTIYAGTGDATASTQSFYGRGVLKSTDGGATWTLLGNSLFNRQTISQVAVDPTNANIIYVSLNNAGVNDISGIPVNGVYKSSDGGQTWTNTTASLSTLDRYSDIEIDPSNTQHLFAASYNGFTADGVYVSNNAGTSWSLVGGGLPSGPAIGVIKIAIAASNPQVVYTSFLTSQSKLLGIWKSSDGGNTWMQLSGVPDYAAGNGFYADSLAVNPTNPNVVYAGGEDGLLQSVDGGAHWTDITIGAGGTSGTYLDHHDEAFDANGLLLDATDGGIFRLANATPGSISWTDLNTNLQTATLLSGSLDSSNANDVIASGQDGGTVQYGGSLGWTQRDTPLDAGSTFIDPQNPLRIYRQVPNTSTTAGGFIRRSDDGGVTWTSITSGIDPTELQSYYAGFAIDPSNGNHLVYGTDRVYESYNGGNTWTAISTPGASGWTAGTTTSVAKLAIAPSDPQRIYASDNGLIFVTINDGLTWTQCNPGNSPFGSITVDPTNPNVVYVTGGNFGSGELMRSSDGGATWQNLSGNLPNLPTYAFAQIGTTLYVGNDNGVYFSTDDGNTWALFGAGLPNVQVRDLRYDPTNNILAAFTYGRGAWEISTAPTPAPLIVNTLNDPAAPTNGVLSLREAIATANSTGQAIGFASSLTGGTITLAPANGSIVISHSMSINGPSAGSITVNTGAALVEVSSGVTATVSNLAVSGSGTVLKIDSTGQAALQDVSLSGNVTDNGIANFDQFADAILSGAIAGTGSLVKNGPFNLTLSGTNSYGGGTTVRSGTLTGNTLSLQGNFSVGGGATLAFNLLNNGSFSGTVTGAGNIHLLDGNLEIGTTSTSAASTFGNFGLTTIDAGTMLIPTVKNDLSAASTFNVNGFLNLGGFDQTIGLLTGTGIVQNVSAQTNPLATLTLGTSGSSTYMGRIEDVITGSGYPGVLAIKKVGNGTVSFAGPISSTYTGGTTVTAGMLNGNSATLEGNIILAGGDLTMDQSLSFIDQGTFTGNISGSGPLTMSNGTIQLAPTSTINVTGSAIDNATLVAGAANQVTQLTVNGAFDLGGFNQNLSPLLGTGAVYNMAPGTQPETATLTLGPQTTPFGGLFEDHLPTYLNLGVLALNIVAGSASPAVLTGSNTYSGGTTFSSNLTDVGPSAGDPLGTGPLTFAGGNVSFQGQFTAQEQAVAFTGYNEDVIADASSTDPSATTTASFDAPNVGGNDVFYAQGFGGAAAQGTGLPSGGTPFVSLSNPSVGFVLQPANSNNVLMLPAAGSGSITVPLTTPGSFASLNFLAASANGATSMSAQLNFSDGTTAVAVFSVPDWFNGSGAAFIAGGRVVREPGAAAQIISGNPRLYEFDYSLGANVFKTLNSITFTQTGVGTDLISGISSRVGVFALSGSRITLSTSQAYANAVAINSPATIDIQNSTIVDLQNATISNNASLTVTGPNFFPGGVPLPVLYLGSVTLMSNALFIPGSVVTLSMSNISDGGRGYGITIDGPDGAVELRGTDTYGGATTDTAGSVLVDTAGGLPGEPLSIGTEGYVQLAQTTAPYIPFTANVSTLTIAAQGTLDITDNAMLIHYGSNPDPMSTIFSYVDNGYHNGSWNEETSYTIGVITSRTADYNYNRTTGIGYADSADGVVPLPVHTIELKYTLYGDTGLTGTVGFTDFMRMTQHFTQNSGATWDEGDFNYDGSINSADFNLLKPNYGQTLQAPAPAMTPIFAAPVTTSPTQRVAIPLDVVTNPPKVKKHPAKAHATRKR